jgi:hypothetical protein
MNLKEQKKETYGTNCTISRIAVSRLKVNKPLSESNRFISLKSAEPTPTITTDKGNPDALINVLIVASMSLITPSVNISSTVNFCDSCVHPFPSTVAATVFNNGPNNVGPENNTFFTASR